MDAGLWEYIKSIITWLSVPIGSLMIWNYQRGVSKIESLENQIYSMKIENATIKQQLADITNRLNEIRDLMNDLLKRRKS